VFLGELREGRPIGGMAEHVDSQDCSGGRGNVICHTLHVEVVRRRVDVYESRRGAHVSNHVGRGHEAEGRGDDLIPRPNVQCVEDEMQRRGAAVCGDSVRGAAPVRHQRFKALPPWTLGEP